mmetsp:Transcript_34821/g.89406  ORF Transcript_34821/g.89406 Transcript_34821/m.89406 type:complete len:258 (+) Transcript_34821:705-1478(+)
MPRGEVVAGEGRPTRILEPLPEFLLQGFGLLRLLPLVTACHNEHVVEDDISDDHEARVVGVAAQLGELSLGAQALDRQVVLRLIPCPPLVASLGLLRRRDLHGVEAHLLDLKQLRAQVAELPVEGVEDGQPLALGAWRGAPEKGGLLDVRRVHLWLDALPLHWSRAMLRRETAVDLCRCIGDGRHVAVPPLSPLVGRKVHRLVLERLYLVEVVLELQSPGIGVWEGPIGSALLPAHLVVCAQRHVLEEGEVLRGDLT